MFSKFISMALLRVGPAEDRKNFITDPVGMIELVRQNFREEISRLQLRLFLGIILTSVVLFALLQLGLGLVHFLDGFENSRNLTFIVFGIMAVTASVGLYLSLHRVGRVQSTSVDPTKDSGLAIDPPMLVAKFVEGLIGGFTSQQANHAQVAKLSATFSNNAARASVNAEIIH